METMQHLYDTAQRLAAEWKSADTGKDNCRDRLTRVLEHVSVDAALAVLVYRYLGLASRVEADDFALSLACRACGIQQEVEGLTGRAESSRVGSP